MRITNQYTNNVSQRLEDLHSSDQCAETASPTYSQPVKASVQNANGPENEYLAQMIQSVLQNALPPNWPAQLKSALDVLGQQEPASENQLQVSSNSDTGSALLAKLLNKQVADLPSVNTNVSILESAKTLADQMNQIQPPISGGFAKILSLIAETTKQKRELQTKGIELMEQAKTPADVQQILEQFGGINFKHELASPQLKDRMTATAQKNEMPDHGFTVSAEQLSKNAEKIEKADGDKTVELAKDTELLRNATPDQKIKMINELGKGFDGHDDKKCIAIDRILSSCKTKEEFDKVLDGAGGKELLTKLNGDEAKKRVNELCGMWGRMDAATMPEVAKKFENLMTDPAKQAEYSGVRPPGADETKNVGANIKNNPADPTMEYASDKVKQNMSDKAFSADWDQGSKVELIREQRRRELSGDAKLDYTSVVAQSEKITNASDDEIRAFKNKKPDEKISDDDRKDYIKEKMEALRKETGLSEQSMNDLVTRKMGNIYAQGAGEMTAYGQQAIGELQTQLQEIVRTKGENSPEAQQLKSRIENLTKNFEANGQQLAKTSQNYHELFPMPPSFSETVGKIFSAIGDVAASVFKMVPGWGQAFSGIYTAAKAIGQGDLVGGIAGFGGMIAGPGYKEACNFVQRASRGDVLDAVGNLSKEMGGAIGEEAIKMGKNIERGDWNAVAGQLSQGASMLVGAGGATKVAAEIAQKGIDTARAAIKIGEGISKGDGFAVIGGMADAAGSFANVNGTVGEIAKYATVGLNTAKGIGLTIDAATKGDVANVFTGINNTISGLSFLAGSAKSPIAGVVGYAQNTAAMLEKFSRGDVAGGLMMGIGLTSPYIKDDGTRNFLDNLQNSLPSVQNLLKGNLSAITPLANNIGNFSTDIQKFINNPEIQKFIVGVGQSNSLIQSVQKGDVAGVVNSLTQKGGMLQTLGGEQFAKAIGNVGSITNELLNSPGMRQMMQFTETGTKIMQNLAAGKTDEVIRMFTGGVHEILPGLSSQIESLISVAQSMAKGNYENVLKELAKNPQTRAFANQLSILQPLANLAQGTSLSNLQNLDRTLRQITEGASQADSAAVRLALNFANQNVPALPQFNNLQQAASLNGPLGTALNPIIGTLTSLVSGNLQYDRSLLQSISGGALSQGVSNLSEAAHGLLSSPELSEIRDYQQELQKIAGLSKHYEEFVALEQQSKEMLTMTDLQ